MSLLRRFLSTVPWFIDKPHIQQHPFTPKQSINPSIPHHAPQIIKSLHSQLLLSPHLDTSALSVGPAVPPPPGPPLPKILPHGRRNRGGTFSGESAYDIPDGGLWSWVVVAQASYFSKKINALPLLLLQVKEGTENRGAIESVVRVIRKTVG